MKIHELFHHYGTDKVEYATLYYSLLEPRRESVRAVLEVGIGTLIPDAPSAMVGWGAKWYRQGGSLRAWRDYFPNASIHGLDVQPDTQFAENRIRTHLCDSTDPQQSSKFLANVGVEAFDLIIDDGSHLGDDQLATLRNLLPHVRAGGLYVIEDVLPDSVLTSRPQLLEAACGGNAFFFVGLERNLVVVSKRAPEEGEVLFKRL